MSNSKSRILILTVFTLLTLFAITGLPELRFSAVMSPDDASQDGASRFATTEQLLISVPEHPDRLGWDKVAETVAFLRRSELAAEIVSPAELQELSPKTDEVSWEPLPPEAAEEQRLWSALFGGDRDVAPPSAGAASSSGPRWWLNYLELPEIQRLLDWRGRTNEEVYFSGVPFLEQITLLETRRTFVRTLPVSLVLILLLQLFLTRSLKTAAMLWITSLLPGLWVLGLFGRLGVPLSWWTMIVPLQVIALSTSYSIHVLRYTPEAGGDTCGLTLKTKAEGVRPVVVRAAITTLLGFATLLSSSLEVLRETGAFISVGVTVSVAAALLLLPSLSSEPVAPTSPGVPARTTRSRSPGRRRGGLRFLPVALVLLILLLLYGVSLVTPAAYLDTLFNRRSAAYADLHHFGTVHGAVERVELTVDTGERYGYTDLARYNALSGLRERFGSIPGVGRVIGPSLVVEHAFGRLTGSRSPRPPESAVDIGETLELIRSRDNGFGIDQLLTADYRQVRMLLFFGVPGENPRQRRSTLRKIENEVERFAAEETWASTQLGGASYERRSELDRMARRFAWSLLLFLPAVFSVLLLMERSGKRAAAAILPILLAALAYAGLHGLLAIPFRFATVLGLAFVLGVSADDAIYVIRSSKSGGTTGGGTRVPPHARAAVVQTTLLLMIGLLPLLFGPFRGIQEMVLLIFLGLGTATVATLTLLPRLLFGSADDQAQDGKAIDFHD